MKNYHHTFIQSLLLPIKQVGFLLSLLLLPFVLFAQETADKQLSPEDSFRLMFYNVENYFDSYNDSLTNDEEYLPDGMRRWGYKRFVKKRNNIYKTIMAVGDMQPPALIGLCEVENRFVLNQLVYKTPFAHFDYRIVHQESPDRRGIDVALLYNPNVFQALYHTAIGIRFPFSPETRTRDILYVKGLVFGSDTLHVFVNHWPSRYGGELNSQPRRMYVAQVLAAKVDSIMHKNANAAIVIMGDFNDYPDNQSIQKILNAGKNLQENRLYHLMPKASSDLGTHKFQGEWGILDQIMVSPALISQDIGIFVEKEAHIFNAGFLLEDDVKFLGEKPRRTYDGARYRDTKFFFLG